MHPSRDSYMDSRDTLYQYTVPLGTHTLTETYWMGGTFNPGETEALIYRDHLRKPINKFAEAYTACGATPV